MGNDKGPETTPGPSSVYRLQPPMDLERCQLDACRGE
jgi:hypothetical protein